MGDLSIREQDLVENPTPRVPICLVLDTSGSMEGDPINELNDGTKMFFDAIRADEVAQYAAEISIVTFGENAAQMIDFGNVLDQTPPTLSAAGSTPMGAAVNLALDLLERRKKEYSNVGVDYFQPWMVLMTDGAPTDSIESAAKRISALVTAKKLTIFPIGIGSAADMAVLQKFSPLRTPLKLKGLNFREFFQWLSKSVSHVSQSTPGENVPLDDKGIKGWAVL